MKRWIIVLVVVALAAWIFGRSAVEAARDFVTRGRRLTRSTIEEGVVVDSIASLVAGAGETLGRSVEVDAYSLARMLRSEYGGGPVAAKLAMAWVAVNDARSLGRAITWTINAGTRQGAMYGAQSGGRYSTAQDPYANDLAIAESVLAGEQADPTDGAVKFVHTSGFAPGAYDRVVASWGKEGLHPVELEGVGSLVVFRKGAA